eukprot:TRINITY_DN88574_c0_g1_i1.p1 TRINITY_DN88574_c0_g1~~TRINITY_DN88574_c0_g1_i1.p1  ORF type:complete len:588 (+),score=64.68 TRINITY_DN88574_c0_g1_i1:23-1786(+)
MVYRSWHTRQTGSFTKPAMLQTIDCVWVPLFSNSQPLYPRRKCDSAEDMFASSIHATRTLMLIPVGFAGVAGVGVVKSLQFLHAKRRRRHRCVPQHSHRGAFVIRNCAARLDAENIPALEQSAPNKDATWQELGVQSEIVAALTETLKIERPNALQISSMEAIVGGHDTILSSYTGSGKTLASLVPLIVRALSSFEQVSEKRRDAQILWQCQPLILVVTHSKGLTSQIGQVAAGLLSKQSAMRALTEAHADKYSRMSGNDSNPTNRVSNRMAEMLEEVSPDIVVGTPKQIVALLANTLDLRFLQAVMFDEVDGLFDKFGESCKRLLAQLPSRGVQVVSASASAFAAPRLLPLLEFMRPKFRLIDSSFCCQEMKTKAVDNEPEKFNEEFTVPPTLKHAMLKVKDKNGHWASTRSQPALAFKQKVDLLSRLVETRSPGELVLVFANKSNGAARQVHTMLNERGVGSKSLTGRSFSFPRYNGSQPSMLPVVIATDEIGARGMDCECIATVVNFDLPISYKNYLHRGGRAGRAGRTGLVVSLVSNPKEERFYAAIMKKIGSPPLHEAMFRTLDTGDEQLQLEHRMSVATLE